MPSPCFPALKTTGASFTLCELLNPAESILSLSGRNIDNELGELIRVAWALRHEPSMPQLLKAKAEA